MGWFSDAVDAVSDAASAVANAASEAWDDVEDAAEDLVDDVQDSWDAGTESLRNAVNNGDFLGAVVGVFCAIGAVGMAVGGNLLDFTMDLGGAAAGGLIAIGGAVLGLVVTAVVAIFDADAGRSAGRFVTDWTRRIGEWVRLGADLGGNFAERVADTGAGILIAVTRRVQCFIGTAKDAIENLGQDESKSAKRPFNKVNHFFVLMLENRSFDHMLGRVPGVNGINSGEYFNWDTASLLKSPALRDTRYNADNQNNAQFSLSVDVLHEFPDVQEQLTADPGMDNGGFVKNYERACAAGGRSPAYAANVMSSFSEETLPILHTLAREFAVCDAWHSSVPGPTVPNRQFLHAATAGGMADSPFNERLGYNLFAGGFDYENGTLFDRLDGVCVPWAIYYGDFPPLVMSLKGINTADAVNGWTRIGSMEDFLEDLPEAEDDDFPNYVFIEPYYSLVLSDYKEGNSQHLLGGVPDGEALIKLVYETIRASPIWNTSALIITYDEHGGFYDHVKPPEGGREATPPGDVRRYESWSKDPGSRAFAFDRLGFRVPAVVVSPLIERGTVDHTVYDHSSVSATLGRRFGFRALTGRDFHANTFDRLFTRAMPRADAPAKLPGVKGHQYMEVDE
jgi:phospholipase C